MLSRTFRQRWVAESGIYEAVNPCACVINLSHFSLNCDKKNEVIHVTAPSTTPATTPKTTPKKW
jgi:hypothetical protein